LPLTSPVLVSHLVFTQDSAVLAGERNRLCRLAQTPCRQAAHQFRHLPGFRWRTFPAPLGAAHRVFKLHGFSFAAAGEPRNAEATALDVLPTEWLRTLPGQMIVATHVELRSSR
jgi:hypothetical protein